MPENNSGACDHRADLDATPSPPPFVRILGKINTEWELKQAAEKVAERRALRDYKDQLNKHFSVWSGNPENRDRPIDITVSAGEHHTHRLQLPRWVVSWIAAGLDNKIIEVEQVLRTSYGIEQ